MAVYAHSDITPRTKPSAPTTTLPHAATNRGVAQENGIVGRPMAMSNGRLEQKLLLRGSCDFGRAGR